MPVLKEAQVQQQPRAPTPGKVTDAEAVAVTRTAAAAHDPAAAASAAAAPAANGGVLEPGAPVGPGRAGPPAVGAEWSGGSGGGSGVAGVRPQAAAAAEPSA